jgi:hypothetical protein
MNDKVDRPLIDTPKEPDRKTDLTDAYQRSEFLMVPRAFFPFFAVLFVLLCGAMAVMLFAVGKIFGGLLFSFVVLVGLYVAYNKLTHKDPG